MVSHPTYTPVAGDTFILKGCDVWINANFPITWTWSGSSGNPITITVDQTWYNTTNCPSTWNRPVFDAGGNPISGSYNQFIRAVSTSWQTWNNIECKGINWRTTTAYGSLACGVWAGTQGGITLDNWYIHGWSHTGGVTSDDFFAFIGDLNSPYNPNSAILHTVMDGSDSTNGGDSGYLEKGFGTLKWNVVHDLSNGALVSGGGEVAYNHIYNIAADFDASVHENAIENIGSTGTYYVHDNVVHDVHGESMFLGDFGITAYVWNNLLYNLANANSPHVELRYAAWTGYYYNNTIVASFSGVCFLASGAGSATITLANNHCIAATGLDNLPSATRTTNLYQTASQATAQGYTSSQSPYVYFPTAGGSTIGTGTNLTASWPGGYSTNDTTYACTVDGTNHVVCPARTSVTRSTWDAGAYQLTGTTQYTVTASASVSCSPVTSSLKTTAVGSVKICKPATGQGGFTCGPPNYVCGLGNRTVVNISHPNFGTNGGALSDGVCDWTSLATLATCGNTLGANTIVTPGDFGSQREVRLTDCNTLTNCGDVWLSADDGLPTLSNMDSTRWIIKRSGGQRYLASFDPATMQGAGLSAVSLDPQESTFSRTTENVLYQLTGGAGTSKVILKKHVITTNTNPALDSDSVTTIKDLGTDANCFGASFTAAWTSLLLSPAGNDTVFTISASTGSQGSANLTVSYNTSTAQCTVLDTSTGAVTQNGTALGNYTSYAGSTTDLFHPHEAYQTPNPRYVVIVGTSSNYIQGTYNSGFYVWDLQNPLSLKSCLNCSGHFALGANGVVFGKALIFTPYSAPTSTGTSTFLPSPPSYPDIHPSWNNGNSGDTLWMLNKAQDDTATPVNPLSGFSVAFFDEIFMVKPDGSGTVSRQHHTFGSSNPNLPFDCQINAANISQDGKWVMWTTDGMGQFGSTSGAGTCTPGTDCRCDLVIGELK